MEPKGILIAIGGNEDKGSEEDKSNIMEFINEGILSTVVRESGGTAAKVAVITTASRIPVEVGENYIEAFTKLGCENIRVLDIRRRKDCKDPEILKVIKEADCIMFSGGDQSRIVDIIGSTEIHDILAERYKNERLVIAGTSAGAMAMSKEMVYGGSSTEAMFKDSVLMRKGLGLIPSLIIDTHFIKRGRFGRLAEAVAKYPELIGAGLAEDTGMIITRGSHIKVIGSGMIIIFDASKLSHNNVDILETGTPMTMANLTVHILANSDEYDLSSKSIQVLPLESEFEN